MARDNDKHDLPEATALVWRALRTDPMVLHIDAEDLHNGHLGVALEDGTVFAVSVTMKR